MRASQFVKSDNGMFFSAAKLNSGCDTAVKVFFRSDFISGFNAFLKPLCPGSPFEPIQTPDFPHVVDPLPNRVLGIRSLFHDDRNAADPESSADSAGIERTSGS